MKKLLLIIILIYSTITLYSQCDNRYQSEIFNSVNVTTVNYSDVYVDNFHEMDIYTPDGDTATNRPLIIFHHGGSYLSLIHI